MLKRPYLHRILFASFASLIITLLLVFLIMWMNGFIEKSDNDDSTVYSICNFDKNLPVEILNPFKENEINIKCSNKKNNKPLILEWFEKLFADDFNNEFIRKK